MKWLRDWWRMRTNDDYIQRGLAGEGCLMFIIVAVGCLLMFYGLYKLAVG